MWISINSAEGVEKKELEKLDRVCKQFLREAGFVYAVLGPIGSGSM